MDTGITIATILVVVFFLIDGIRRGLVRQIFEVIGLVAAFIGAFYVGHYLAERFEGSTRISYRAVLFFCSVAVFIVVAVAFHLIGRLFQKIVSVTVLAPVDRIGGAVFGALKGVLFVSLICVIIFSVPSLGGFKETLRANRVATKIHPVLPRMYNYFMRHSSSRLDFDMIVRADGMRETL